MAGSKVKDKIILVNELIYIKQADILRSSYLLGLPSILDIYKQAAAFMCSAKGCIRTSIVTVWKAGYYLT